MTIMFFLFPRLRHTRLTICAGVSVNACSPFSRNMLLVVLLTDSFSRGFNLWKFSMATLAWPISPIRSGGTSSINL